MSLSQQVLQIWTRSGYQPPSVPLIFYENEYMATVDDTGTFLRFISSDGQIFLALNTNCQLAKPDDDIGDTIYFCKKVDPILCAPVKGPEYVKDLFVLNNIAPLLQ